MVVDSSDVDASESHSRSADDALNAESGDHGFVWTTDHATTEPNTDIASNDQFEWKSSSTENGTHDRHDTTGSESVERAAGRTDPHRSLADTGGDTSGLDMNHDGGKTIVSKAFDTATSEIDGPNERVSIDPIDYPLEELRTIADCEDIDIVSPESETEIHGFVWSEPPEQHRTHVEDPTPEQHQRLLTIVGVDPERIGEKPYLTTLSTEDAGAFITGWLEFLTVEAGTQGAIDALERYCEVGWMTEPVTEELKDSLQWVEHHDGDGFETLDRGDHLLSFAYVAKIVALSAEGMMFY